MASSDPQHIERALLISSAAPSTLPLQANSRISSGTNCSANSVASRGSRTFGTNNHRHRPQKAFLLENPDEDSPSDSPLLLKSEASASFSGPGAIDRHKRKRKSAVSLQAFSRPFHSIWQNQDSPSSTQEPMVGLTTSSVNEKPAGAGNRLHRLLKYLKRPLSDDPMDINEQRQPSLV